MYPWQDYSGRLSPLKLAVFVALFLPALWTAFAFGMGWLQPRPFTEAIHQVGLWMLRFLFIALAITPLRQIVQWPRLILVRRMIGVAAFAYGLAHITLYVADLKFDVAKAASEIALRIYLTIGFVALLGLAALAATSTDAMVRRMGRRWQSLHRIVYVIALLAVVHYWIQSKLDVWEPTIMAGIYLWLMGYRRLLKTVGVRRRRGPCDTASNCRAPAKASPASNCPAASLSSRRSRNPAAIGMLPSAIPRVPAPAVSSCAPLTRTTRCGA